MSIAITACKADDITALTALENECFDVPYTVKMLSDMLSNPISLTLKAVLNGQIIGYITLETVIDEAELIRIAVRKANRRLGAGRLLINSAIERLLTANVKKLFLEVDETNSPAMNLYNNCGFSIINKREKYYGDRAAVIMQKNL